jgi:hypothetical protein
MPATGAITGRDRDLAQLYCVETRVLKQAVRKNITRFPEDFMFEMTKDEFEKWRSQFVTSKGKGGLCFTHSAPCPLRSALSKIQ